ncbi:hypothetical protein MHK_008848 [Candidatus Magnetomorum sp. HK-1]|nr:hypothetical protein MHK_008848 [Candidatus Magnetomorum sp. HK-1]
MTKTTYTININTPFYCKTSNNKTGLVYEKNSDDPIEWDGQEYTLSELSTALLTNKESLDERFQLILGHHLYSQIFGDTSLDLEMNLHKEIRIISEDENICRLPWQLLAKDGQFLIHNNCSIMLSCKKDFQDAVLPELPKILMIMPQPATLEKTDADNHLNALNEQLSMVHPRYSSNEYMQVVKTWKDFKHKIQTFQPHIIYYYGHGIGTTDASRLVFCDKHHKSHEVSMIDFSQKLRKLETPPTIAYINCCYGDTGGLIGAGKQLGDFIPAVITNRTEVYIEDAQHQGLAFFKRVLLDGEEPHVAVNLIYQDMSVTNTRWLTPIMHCNYNSWTYKPKPPVSSMIHDTHWRVKLDRIKQFSQVKYMTEEMLTNQRPKILSYLWYGEQGQGIDQFHHRLRVELREKLSPTELIEITPIWPPHFVDFHESCENMYRQAFNVQSFLHIPSQIRELGYGKQSLIYIRHTPLTSTRIVNLKVLKRYIEWLDQYFLPLLKQDKFFALVGVSYIVNQPAKISRLIEKKKITTAHYTNTVFRVLDEMKKLDKQDLYDFLQTHNIRLPYDSKEKVLNEILSKTNGHYEQTLYELENLVNRAWAMDDKLDDDIDDDDEDEGFGVDD